MHDDARRGEAEFFDRDLGDGRGFPEPPDAGGVLVAGAGADAERDLSGAVASQLERSEPKGIANVPCSRSRGIPQGLKPASILNILRDG